MHEIPSWLLAISQLFPSTPAVQGLLQLNQMGADFSMVAHFQMQLLMQALGFGLLAIVLIYYKQGQHRLRQLDQVSEPPL